MAYKPAIRSMQDEVNRLLRLKSDNAKNALNNVDDEVAITYLSELYKGNGWTVAFHAGAWNHRSLLISDPKQPDAILWIVKFILGDGALSYERVKNELLDFENNLGPLYECTQFSIVAPNGFEAKTERLEDYNLLLQNWTDVEELIDHYSKDKKSEPRIQLFAHNKQTYKKVKKMMTHAKGVAVVQATGTGKSYLIAKLLQDFAGKRRLVMAPSIYIIDQIKEHIRWETDLPGDTNKIDFMTYARSMYLTPAEINGLKPEMIVLDEFHRCGAEEWGRGVQDILNAYPNKFKLGTSATPIRYLDNGRDMSIELFQGHVAENLSLAQAIVRNILPMPKYVCALYTLSEEINTMRSRIAGSRKNEETKKKLLLELDAFHIDWEQSRGIPHVLKKHLRSKMRKFIVFCKDEEHLNEMEPIVKKWFKEAMNDIAVKTYKVHSKEAERDEQLEAFKGDTSKDQLHLLFSIDMLNEGLHVNEVNGVVLLRPTESPNIFYQQIGRCLKVGLNHQPVIFDFVNNFKSIHTHDFLYDLDFARKELLDRRFEEGLEDRCPRFNVNDEVREIKEVFGEIQFKLNNWLDMYEKLVEYHRQFGHANVPYLRKEKDNSLADWVGAQRQRYYYGKLDDDSFQKLDALGVEWNYQPIGSLNERWEQQFRNLDKFRKKHGNCYVPDTDEYRILNRWVALQRKNYRNGILDKDKVKQLEAIGFDFLPDENLWQEQFNELRAYKNKHGHTEVSPTENKSLNMWMIRQRKNGRQGLLVADRMEALNSIGFAWQTGDGIFESKFIALQEFHRQFHHFTFPLKHPLYSWSRSLKYNYNKGLLTELQVKKLKSIGFDLTIKETQIEIRDKRFAELQKFYDEHGHIDVTGNKHYSRLIIWLDGIRGQKKNGTLSAEFIARLDAMGMDWDRNVLDRKWNKMYEKLLDYYHQNGTTFIEAADKTHPELKRWCITQRKARNEGSMPEERIKKLDKIKFAWSYDEAEWETRYGQLSAFKKHYNHCNIGDSYKNDYAEFTRTFHHLKIPYAYTLHLWAKNQKKRYQQSLLTDLQIKKLKGIGFDFADYETNLGIRERRLEELRKFYKKYQHFDITSEYKDFRKLGEWLANIRFKKKKGILAKEFIASLDAIGKGWETSHSDSQWNNMYEKLDKYVKQKSTCLVSKEDDPELNIWCIRQRKIKKEGAMPRERLDKLNKIGFVWSHYDAIWEERFQELIEFKKRYGHCNVTESYKKEYDKLYQWRYGIFQKLKAGKVSSERIKRLEAIGFDGSPLDTAWEERFNELLDFKKLHGHCKVNFPFKNEYPALYHWHAKVLREFKKGKLSKERMKKLKEIGFE